MPEDWFAQFESKPAGAESASVDWFAQFEGPKPDDAPKPENGMGAVSALAATGAAAVPAALAAAERFGTSPILTGLADKADAVMKVGRKVPGLSSLINRAPAANLMKQGYDVVTGRQSLLGAGADYARNAAMASPGKTIRGVQNLALRAASTLGAEGVAGMAAPAAVPLAGGLAGVAGTAGFLGALQHDANRTVTIDYQKNTPDTAVARVFSNMRDSEANRGKTLAERQDDPNDVMFTPDDQATVSGGEPSTGSRVSAVVQAFFGRRAP